MGCKDSERVVLWAVNSTYAYHMLTVAPQELWLQGFLLSYRVRIDRRSLFSDQHSWCSCFSISHLRARGGQLQNR